MATRREFLQAGLGVSALPMLAGNPTVAVPAAVAADEAPAPFYLVVYDERFPASVAFATEMERLGESVCAIRGDITELWANDLDARWRVAPIAIAGLTAHGPLFCLERLSWDYGMRVGFRGEHTYSASGCVEHALSGPPPVIRSAEAANQEADDWAAGMASLVARCRHHQPATSALRLVSAPLTMPPTDAEPLFSWVIAPVTGSPRIHV